MRSNIINVVILSLAACGGSSTSRPGGKAPEPPPTLKASQPDVAEPGKGPVEVVKVSADAKKDYQAAVANFQNNEKGGWNEGACNSSADKFSAVVHEHSDMTAAQFMVGLSYQRCGMTEKAESAYLQCTKMKGDVRAQAMALSNLGQIYYKAGKVDSAKQYWDNAIKANGKLVAARINVASMNLEQMRKINNVKDGQWKKLEEDARFNLSNALGVEPESVEAYTVFGLVYMEGWQQNKNRLDLAKTLMDEANKRNPKYPPLLNAYGLYWMHKGSINQALQAFEGAVAGDPKFFEARINAGLLTLGARKYDVAKEHFAKALEVAPKNYDAMIGLGIAQRGLGDLDGAEKSYKQAMQLDGSRGDAYYNLGVLYKDFKATKAEMKASIPIYQQAKDYFQQFLGKTGDADDKAEAKDNIKDCDKVQKSIETFLKNQANNPPPAAPAPTATPPKAPDAKAPDAKAPAPPAGKK